MYPDERSLVKKLKGKPFVLLGINSDKDRTALKQTLVKEQISWRSWWDESIDGRIHNQWQIQERPAIYLIDGSGTIRHKNVQPEDLDAAIETLLAKEPVSKK
jgi:hypothetical protein